MAAHKEARRAGGRDRASGNSAERHEPEAIVSSHETQDVAVAWLRTRYGLSVLRAGLVAGLAFAEFR